VALIGLDGIIHYENAAITQLLGYDRRRGWAATSTSSSIRATYRLPSPPSATRWMRPTHSRYSGPGCGTRMAPGACWSPRAGSWSMPQGGTWRSSARVISATARAVGMTRTSPLPGPSLSRDRR
jgi:hypothetical protein